MQSGFSEWPWLSRHMTIAMFLEEENMLFSLSPFIMGSLTFPVYYGFFVLCLDLFM